MFNSNYPTEHTHVHCISPLPSCYTYVEVDPTMYTTCTYTCMYMCIYTFCLLYCCGSSQSSLLSAM